MIFLILIPQFVLGLQLLACTNEKKFTISNQESLTSSALLTNYNITAIQTKLNVHLLDQRNTQVSLPLTDPLYLNCQKVFASGDMIYVTCLDGTIPMIQAYKCTSFQCFTLYKPIPFPIALDQIEKLKIIENTMMVLQKDKICIFTIVINGDIDWYLRSTPYIMDAQFFQKTAINITDFHIQELIVEGSSLYKIYISERTSGLLWADAVIRSHQLIPYNYGSVNLRTVVTLRTITQFISVHSVGTPIIIGTNQTLFYLFTTNDDSQYVFKTYFTQQNATSTLFKFLLSRYKDWNNLGSIAVSKNVVAIPYQFYQGSIVISLYNLPALTEEIEGLQALGVDQKDLLIMPDLDSVLMYFTQIGDETLFTYRSDTDTLTQCSLSAYTVE